MSKRWRVVLVSFVGALAVLAGFSGCATPSSANEHARGPSALPPQDNPAIAAGLHPGEALRARQLYLLKCARCHRFYDPAQYSDLEWETWMKKMSRKARLKPEQDELLSKYLQAFR